MPIEEKLHDDSISVVDETVVYKEPFGLSQGTTLTWGAAVYGVYNAQQQGTTLSWGCEVRGGVDLLICPQQGTTLSWSAGVSVPRGAQQQGTTLSWNAGVSVPRGAQQQGTTLSWNAGVSVPLEALLQGTTLQWAADVQRSAAPTPRTRMWRTEVKITATWKTE